LGGNQTPADFPYCFENLLHGPGEGLACFICFQWDSGMRSAPELNDDRFWRNEMNLTNDTLMNIRDDMVVTLEYTLKVDGAVIDTSENSEPIQFIQGQGHIIPGLERQLYGMSKGESKLVAISPAEGYGEVDDKAYTDVPRSQFPADIPLEIGIALQLRDQSGETLNATIAEIDQETVHLNFNHPLAGKELNFSIKVVDLREATPEEMDHGHVHDSNGDDDDEDLDE
jgi:FKBP-type peptidyl-prolyl cis-trans isomerase SlyD